MEKVIEFPGFKTDHNLYEDDLKEALAGLSPALRDAVREAMELSTQEYVKELSEKIDITLPPGCQKEHVQSIQAAIENLQNICKRVIQALAVSKAEQVLDAWRANS